MTDLTKAIKQLEPLAQAIIVLAGHAGDLEKLKVRVSELQANVEQRQSDWTAAEVSAQKAKTAVIEANAQVIMIQKRCEQMSEEASKRAQQIIAEAQVQARADAKSISDGYKAEHAKLLGEIDKAERELAELGDEIIGRRKDHDAVLASIEALSKRLVGAA